MDGLSILDPCEWDPAAMRLHPAYAVGNAAAWLSKVGGEKTAAGGLTHYLSGRLYVSKSGWLLLSVPNALVRGVFDAMTAPGVELPLAGAMNVPDVKPDLLNAHISVMTADEVASIGANKINERGHHFHYALGPVKEIAPKNIDGISRVWALQVASPELAALRKSYGLSALPKDDQPFHIAVAVRRTNVLRSNEVSKFDAASGRGETKAASARTTYDCSCSGPCRCPDSCVCKRNGLCGNRNKNAEESKDVLPGGPADGMPDSDFPQKALAEGAKHEHEHTNNGEIAKEIAKDHLQEDAAYYEKLKKVEKSANSVYTNQLWQKLNPTSITSPIRYDPTKPVFENVKDQLAEVKRRGDFILQTRRNQRIWRAQVDPSYRYRLLAEAIEGRTPQPGRLDQVIERYGDGILAQLPGANK